MFNFDNIDQLLEASFNEAEPKLGSGERFKKGTEEIQRKEGISKKRAKSIMAAAGRKKYGKEKFQKLATKGRQKATKESLGSNSIAGDLLNKLLEDEE